MSPTLLSRVDPKLTGCRELSASGESSSYPSFHLHQASIPPVPGTCTLSSTFKHPPCNNKHTQSLQMDFGTANGTETEHSHSSHSTSPSSSGLEEEGARNWDLEPILLCTAQRLCTEYTTNLLPFQNIYIFIINLGVTSLNFCYESPCVRGHQLLFTPVEKLTSVWMKAQHANNKCEKFTLKEWLQAGIERVFCNHGASVLASRRIFIQPILRETSRKGKR